ncbi:MAG: hypothetical protein AABZ31_09975 [Bdellovibrionota bacterium]
MRNLIALIVFIGVSATAFADNNLPFNIVRDENGKLVRVLIDHKKKAFMSTDEFLNEFKISIAHVSKGMPIDRIEMEGFSKLSKKEQKAYIDSIDSLQQKTIMNSLDDEKVKVELDKVVAQLTSKGFFKLLADPGHPKAFDEELIIVEGVEKLMDVAKEVLGSSPLFSVLEFLVSEYFDALTAQREFYQNALLTYMNSNDEFTAEEQAQMKSSIFYSRLGLTKFSSRKKAIKEWATFGLKQEKEFNKKCSVTDTTSFHYCFKFDKTAIVNVVNKNNSLAKSSSTSTTFDYKKPGYTGQTRWFIMAARLGLKLLPVPGLVKSPVNKWLKSFYVQQRRTEGLLYSAATLKNESELAGWILENTANPLIH